MVFEEAVHEQEVWSRILEDSLGAKHDLPPHLKHGTFDDEFFLLDWKAKNRQDTLPESSPRYFPVGKINKLFELETL